MEEEVRIGVFVCRCGSNIANVVDIHNLVEYSKKLDNVILVDQGKWSCSADYIDKMSDLIRENHINRVVIASCSPRTHESLFKQAVKNVGLNPYLLEFVSIREQVSWVHMDFPDIATQKAKDLVKMGVAKATILEEGFEIKLPVQRRCLIIGGGASGINAALSIANQGFKAFIVERETSLGGILKKASFFVSENEKITSKKILSNLLEKVANNSNITVFNSSEIKSLQGYIGSYYAEIKQENSTIVKLDIDTIIVATGMRELQPVGKFFYGIDKRVITQVTLEHRIAKKTLDDINNVVMITCINSKNNERGCCNIGCHITLKNAIFLKKANPIRRVSILYRDLSIHKKSGSMLAEAKKIGINFVRFHENKYPEIILNNNELDVNVFDILLGKTVTLRVDHIVLTTAFIGSKNTNKIKGLLKVSTNNDDFFQEAHVKLHPLEFPSDGIGLSGCSKNPMFFEESCNEGIGAAMRVSIPMYKKYTRGEGIVASLNLKNCKNCSLCVNKCPYSAIIVDDNYQPKVINALCRGCGLCAADCPTSSISIIHYSDEQILSQITAALDDKPANKIIGFVCHWCALGGVDMAGIGRLQYPTNVRLIRVMCSARVSVKMLEYAFKLGAGGVLVAGCEFPTCHYISGNYEAKKRINRAKKKLKKQGFNSERLWLTWCSAADGPKFASVIKNMVEKLELKKEII